MIRKSGNPNRNLKHLIKGKTKFHKIRKARRGAYTNWFLPVIGNTNVGMKI